jgi:hypothetical protein
MPMSLPAQHSRAPAADPASTVARKEVSHIDTTSIDSGIEESAAPFAPPARPGNTTRARVLPEADAFERPHPSPAPVTASVAARSTSRTAPSSIDVRIGAIKLDIHQAAPLQRPTATPAVRNEPRRDTPRFAPRRYYLSGW